MGLALVTALFTTVFAQEKAQDYETQEAGDDGIPVILKHLPEWESNYEKAEFFSKKEDFTKFFDNRDIIQAIDFIPGTEAVYARYGAGNLLIVEYMTPQAAKDTNEQIIARSKKTSDRFLYRRIGNYNVFLFDPANKGAGNQLLDQIKYQKVVTWPNGDPFIQFRREREFIVGTKSLFIYTVVFILTGFGIAILIGIIGGIVYYKMMQQSRIDMDSFSDAGGLTRLNLDGLSADIAEKAKRLRN